MTRHAWIGFFLLLAALPAVPSRAVDDAAPAFPIDVTSTDASFRVEKVAEGLSAPVSMVFLPDGRGLLAERAAGRLSYVDPATGAMTPVTGLPAFYTEQDSGILDVALHPAYAQNGWVYLVYSIGDDKKSTLQLGRFHLRGDRAEDFQILYTLAKWADWEEHGFHYGGRLVFADGSLFMTIGERHRQDNAQDRSNALGTVVRLKDDGSVPEDNPFVGQKGMLPEIWSYGHRNPQGLALDPATGVLWEHEHGPLGGDELNIILRGHNYGWPKVTFGKEYDGTLIGGGRRFAPDVTPPVFYWTMVPSGIAPSDMIVYSGKAFPLWKGNLLLGAMAKRHLRRLVTVEGRVLHEEELLREELHMRVRMVREAPDGTLYLGTDAGYLLHLVPTTAS